MITAHDLKMLEVIAKSYAVANTPLFLLRKIKEFGATRLVGQRDGQQTLTTLKASLAVVPSTPEEEVAPYFFVVALSFNDNKSFLSEAVKLSSPHHRWYDDICAALQSGRMSTTNVKVTTRPRLIVT